MVRHSATAASKPSSTVSPSRSVRQSWQKMHPLICAMRMRAASNSRRPSVDSLVHRLRERGRGGPDAGHQLAPHVHHGVLAVWHVDEHAPMLARMPRTGAYPGSFDPPTVAHLAVVDADARAGRARPPRPRRLPRRPRQGRSPPCRPSPTGSRCSRQVARRPDRARRAGDRRPADRRRGRRLRRGRHGRGQVGAGGRPRLVRIERRAGRRAGPAARGVRRARGPASGRRA